LYCFLTLLGELVEYPKEMLRWTLLACLLILSGCNLVAPGGELNASTSQLTLTNRVGAFTLTNEGVRSASINFSIRSDNPLISATPTTGKITPTQPSQAIRVEIDQSGLQAGEEVRGTLAITSNAGDVNVSVVYTAQAQGLAFCGTAVQSVATAPGAAQSIADRLVQRPIGPYVPDQLLIRYHAPMTLASAQERLEGLALVASSVEAAYGLSSLRGVFENRPSLVAVPDGVSLTAMMALLNADPRVAYAEPNYYLTPLTSTDDPFLDGQWNLLEFGVPEAWQVETGSGNVVIAIIDSGVETTHEDLVDKMLPGCDFFDQDNDPNPGPPNGGRAEHGTHVAGIAAATGNNGVGIAGVAYGAGVRILPVKVFDNTGIQGTVDGLIDAILWSAGISVSGVGVNNHPAHIINMSLSAGNAILQSVNEATARAKARGAVLIAASGNAQGAQAAGQGVVSPANSPSVLAVGSVDADYSRSSFSRYDTEAQRIDFMAPGGIGSLSYCHGVFSTIPQSTYGCQMGTSMAVPFVAGVAALILSQNPALTPDAVTDRLRDSALFTDTMTPQEYGFGVVCADRALGLGTQCGMTIGE
jgi:serine protease